MTPRFSVADQRRSATKRIVLCCGFVGFSFLAIAWFGLHQRLQASESILPDHQVAASPTKTKPKLVASYGKLPLSFEANQGQTDARVRFLARGGGYTIFLTGDEAVLTLRKSQPGMSRLGKFGLPGRLDPLGPVDPRAGRWPSLADNLKSLWPSLIPDLGQMVPEPNEGKRGVAAGPESQPPQVMRMRLVGGNAQARVIGVDELPGRSNYFIGNDPKKWRTNVSNYAKVKYQNVYPGVDLVYHGNQRQLEYDFVLAPGADPNQIKLSFAGTDGTRIDAANGDLVLKVGDDEVRFHKPAVYQPAVAAVYDPQTRGPKVHALECGSLLPLCAPQLAAGFSGGTDAEPSDWAPEASFRRGKRQQAAALEGGLRPQMSRLDSGFVLASNNEVAFRVAGYDPKRALVIDPVLTYSTYLGGSSFEYGQVIAVDSTGSAYVTGTTGSTNFPTKNPLQAKYQGGDDAYVAKFEPDGSALVYSTYLGGSGTDYGSGIAVDSSGNAYVTGQTSSTDFPTVNPLQASNGGGYDAFVAELNAAGAALVYSTYLGGSSTETAQGIAVDSSGNAYVTGYTNSTNFPTMNPLQPTNNGGYDAFVAELNFNASSTPPLTLVYSTYLGGSGADYSHGIAVDSSGNAYVTGQTTSTDFPTVNPLQPSNGGDNDVFVAKLNFNAWSTPPLTLVYSTYLGADFDDVGNGIAVDSSGSAYVTGETSSPYFPTVNPIQVLLCGFFGACNSYPANDAFVAKLNADGSALVYSTFLGGSNDDLGCAIAVDSSGNAYVTGRTSSTNFPTANPFQAQNDGGNDAFVAELNAAGSALVYSTYLGGSGDDVGLGIAVDSSGNAYVIGNTRSTDFPVTSGAFQMNFGGDMDAFVAKISPGGGAFSVSFSPTSLTFGAQNVGTTSAPQTVTATNTGTADLTISYVGWGGPNSGDFATSDECSGATVALGAHCTVSVKFEPLRAGTRSASLLFYDNGPNMPQTVSLTGTGVGTAPVVSVWPQSLTFGEQKLGTTSASQPVTLSNFGNAALSITSIAISANFGQNNNCGSSVAASGSCTINVTFSPTAASPLTGTLTITDNSDGVAGSKQTVSLAGTGVTAIAVTLRPASASVALSGTQLFTATISNTTNTALNWYVNGVLNGNATQGTLTACTTVAPLTCTYAAPPANLPSPNPAVIKVASVADPSKFATANVTVTDSIAVTLSPSSASLALGGTQLFTATVSNTTNTALNWYVNGVLNGNATQGRLTGTGLTRTYTAPPVNVPGPNPAVIKVASVADPSKIATAKVTVTDSIAVTLSPSSASLALGGTQLFTATISNTTDTALNWYVNGVLNGNATQGTLRGTGLTRTYTAPPVYAPDPNPAVIKVASVADPGKYKTASVTVRDGIAVTLSPSSASLALGGTQWFTATISNTTNTALNWYVNGVLNGNATQGRLTAAGLTCTYTAPPVNVPNPNPAVIKVASVADPSKFATAKVTVTDSIAVTLSPSRASLALGGTQLFTATISNTTNTALNWYVNGVLNGNATQGTLTGTGLKRTYTAPPVNVPSPNPAVIKVAGVADPSKFATANVTVQ